MKEKIIAYYHHGGKHMRNLRVLSLSLVALALALPLFLTAPTAAWAEPNTQDVAYQYDPVNETFTLYTSSYGPNHILSPTLMVDGQPAPSDAVCTDRTWVSYGVEFGDSTCIFSGVGPATQLASTGTVQQDPSGFSTTTYRGTFKVICRKVAAQGCDGTVSVHMRAVR